MKEPSKGRAEGCLECSVIARERTPAGGLIHETARFVVHSLVAPSPLRGWLVLAPKRHARWWWELDDAELAEIGPLAARVFRAQRTALGAEHGYAFAIGDVLHHMHLHLIPRFADTPVARRGRGAFDAPPEEMLSEEEVARAAEAVGRVLAAVV
jgi:diadenosine tetraphosphate (Ap4A) HIT family hydrolase